MKPILLAALSLLTLSNTAIPQDRIIRIPKLDNARVKVTEVVYEPGAPRARSIRQTDQVIVFLEGCQYRRTDSKTGAKTVQRRKSGEVIWHTQGEDAPVLVNLGKKPYRTVVIELK